MLDPQLDAPARDSMTGLDLPVAGCNELDGYQALAFVRSRYYETYEKRDGRWINPRAQESPVTVTLDVQHAIGDLRVSAE